MCPSCFPLFIVFSLTVLLPRAAHGDSIEVADLYDGCCFAQYDPATALSAGVFDIANGVALSSNPNALSVYPDGRLAFVSSALGITSGPLIGSFAGTSIYAPGTVSFGAGFVQIPSGATCAEFGWPPDQYGETGYCALNQALSRTTGVVTISYGGVVAQYSNAVLRDVLVTTPVTFVIAPDLAFALGISTGPYVGSFELEGVVAEDPNSGYDALAEVDPIEVTGFTTPEPTSLVLLGTFVIFVGFVSWLRPSDVTSHPGPT